MTINSGNPSPGLASVLNLEAARALLFSDKANREVRRTMDIEVAGQALHLVLVSPTYQERRAIYQHAGIGKTKARGKGQSKESEVNVDVEMMRVHAMIACTHVVEGEGDTAPVKKLFNSADEELLLSRYVGGPFDAIADACMELINVDEEELRKNSKTTAS